MTQYSYSIAFRIASKPARVSYLGPTVLFKFTTAFTIHQAEMAADWIPEISRHTGYSAGPALVSIILFAVLPLI